LLITLKFLLLLNKTETVRCCRYTDKLVRWTEEWLMTFNVDKCKATHIGQTNPEATYNMNGKGLKTIKHEKDLAGHITTNMKSSRQCQEAYEKASKALGLTARTMSCKKEKVLLPLCKTLVRPHLEYFVVA
jgi:hypothetical protein